MCSGCHSYTAPIHTSWQYISRPRPCLPPHIGDYAANMRLQQSVLILPAKTSLRVNWPQYNANSLAESSCQFASNEGVDSLKSQCDRALHCRFTLHSLCLCKYLYEPDRRLTVEVWNLTIAQASRLQFPKHNLLEAMDAKVQRILLQYQ